ncbi:MAG: hypothetical protein JXB26_20190 [Candidatus Aminicenantes bacterium]|nr:hypothetical protein [Candidatus Aminicenantes bacterium]
MAQAKRLYNKFLRSKKVNEIEISPGLNFFGNLVSFDCHIQDLKLVLQKTEEIKFPEREDVKEMQGLISDIFPDITRKAFIVALLVVLEDQFKTFCGILRNAKGLELKWNDLKGSALERFIAYSEKVGNLEKICDDSMRELVKGLFEVRNCIVHNNSSLEGFNKAEIIKSFSKQIQGVELRYGYVSFGLDACYACGDIVFRFMEYAYCRALKVFPSEH